MGIKQNSSSVQSLLLQIDLKLQLNFSSSLKEKEYKIEKLYNTLQLNYFTTEIYMSTKITFM